MAPLLRGSLTTNAETTSAYTYSNFGYGKYAWQACIIPRGMQNGRFRSQQSRFR